jgi:hypothetical protein
VRPLVTGLLRFAAVLIAVTGLSGSAPWVQAGITDYYSESSFGTAAPGLTVDTFNGSGVVSSPYSNMPGLTLGGAPSSPHDLIFYGSGIAPNYFGTNLILNFSPDVTAFGVDVEGAPASGKNGPPGTLIADIYLQGSSSPHETTFSLATNTPAFFGAISTTPITKVSLLFDYNSDAFTILSQASYGSPGTQPSSVPEPGSMVLTAVAAGCTGLWVATRRGPRRQPKRGSQLI